jgi:hypothetical protein
MKTWINLSADLYDIFPAKRDHFRPVDLIISYNKTMFPIWGDIVQKFV